MNNDDLVDLPILNEAELLFNIRKRYEDDLIFTYVGPTLVCMNPYKDIPSLFS